MGQVSVSALTVLSARVLERTTRVSWLGPTCSSSGERLSMATGKGVRAGCGTETAARDDPGCGSECTGADERSKGEGRGHVVVELMR